MNHSPTRIPALNTGVIMRRCAVAKPKDGGKRTIVVTGIARSGTSLVASVLRAAGLHMGDFVHEVVNEDAQMLDIVRSRNLPLLRGVIKERNAEHPTWGFKIPDLHAHLRHDELQLFRNPHLIVIYRDPVAVAMRNALSEHTDQFQGVMAASGAMQAMSRFAEQAGCPILLLSYEKAVSVPALLIDSLLDFCGIAIGAAKRAALLDQVKPNNPDYLAVASRHFLGRIDGFMDGALYGWCFEENRLEPVRLEVLANDRLVESVLADQYRADLAGGGVGNGCHGFSIDLSHHTLPADAAIQVKIAGRNLNLENSGQRVSQFAARVSV